MKPVYIFSGTSDGRELCEDLARAGRKCIVSVATRYGTRVMEKSAASGELVQVREGRMDEAQMEQELALAAPEVVVDATHPYAVLVTKQIRQACHNLGLKYLRLCRPSEDSCGGESMDRCIRVKDAAQAAEFLAAQTGNVLLTTGSKDLHLYQDLPRERLYVRVLPAVESLEICQREGLQGAQILAMQGPFDKEMNIATIHRCDATWLVTKESGQKGGFLEKIEAAMECGCGVVIIGRPEENADSLCAAASMPLSSQTPSELSSQTPSEMSSQTPSVMSSQASSSPSAALSPQQVREALGVACAPAKKELCLIATGPGESAHMTQEAFHAFAACDLIFGAPRMIETARVLLRKCGKTEQQVKLISKYMTKDVLPRLEQESCRRAGILFSGDTGFFSGANNFVEACGENYDLKVYPGISSLAYLASKLQKPWQNWHIASFHGREVTRSELGSWSGKTAFCLLAGAGQLRELGRMLEQVYGEGLPVTYGFQLSYPEEEIRSGTVRVLQQIDPERKGLYVLLVEAPARPSVSVLPGYPDEAFLRAEKVPMTKSEIRAISICKLRLSAGDVLWDIGAGSGSVSVEAAAIVGPTGQVYSVEREERALALLAEQKQHFDAENMTIVSGNAPQACRELPAPTHVFLGGTGGNTGEILDELADCRREIHRKMHQETRQEAHREMHQGARQEAQQETQPDTSEIVSRPIRVVANAITLETQQLLMGWCIAHQIEPEVVNVSISRSEKIGGYHLMKAQNPIMIMAFDIPAKEM